MSSRSSTSFSSSMKANASSSVRLLGHQLHRPPVRQVGQVLLLLVDHPARVVGHRVVVGGQLLGHQLGAHPVHRDHRAADLVDLAQVVGGAGGHLAEHDVLGHAPAQQHDHVVEQLLLGLEVAVLLGQVERVAERLAARDDRDAVDLLHRGQHLRAERVARLVVGHHALLVLGDHAARLHAGDHALERGLEVRGEDLRAVLAAGEDRGLVADVGQVGAGQAAGLARDHLEVHVLRQRLVARVHVAGSRGGP